MSNAPIKRKAAKAGPEMWQLSDIESRPDKSVAAFLTSSYIYYHGGDLPHIMSDEDFDKICQLMLLKWRVITHPHKHLINRTMLQAGTGFNLKLEDYPLIVRSTAVHMSTGYIRKYMGISSKTGKKRSSPPKRRSKKSTGFLK